MEGVDWLREAYEARFGFGLLQTDAQGRITAGAPVQTDCSCRGAADARRRQAADETLYWGETVINLCCDNGFAIWGVPVRCNNVTHGALVVQGIDLEDAPKALHESVQRAAEALLDMAIEANLIAEAEVKLARQRALVERDRFLALEASKQDLGADDLRSLYLREEPELLTAIKHGRVTDARSVLNRILTGIYGVAGDRMELLKSCVMELVVMMHRAAVEAGANPNAILGANYRSLTELSEVADEEELSAWVRRMLDTLIEGIRQNEAYPHSLLLLRAINHMRAHLNENLRRDDVARIAGVSPSHFSKLMTQRMGRSFSQLLTQMRINRARGLLGTTTASLSDIALECGFYDQSHFAKAFRAAAGESPGEYRRRIRGDGPRAANP